MLRYVPCVRGPAACDSRLATPGFSHKRENAWRLGSYRLEPHQPPTPIPTPKLDLQYFLSFWPVAFRAGQHLLPAPCTWMRPMPKAQCQDVKYRDVRIKLKLKLSQPLGTLMHVAESKFGFRCWVGSARFCAWDGCKKPIIRTKSHFPIAPVLAKQPGNNQYWCYLCM